ncbi:restriction endonuclease subunit S [Vibrio parahaemolyticus]|uniref:restriction endonuclease subunit S n=1 Tax=Vibrio parahaemolyticus TaxID=670 RepID=UPI001965B395|nr:restriction endonuclease subunit S [Vibrio parahaemolyticus]MCR9724321.1 restriction endonuclease subunit S [Vibrio parahaemolyticus]MCR9742420.1 restriction endonuclease subunit S [Vibrio parahaemolyticus]UJX10457.1 restriction endonuclease subunit S [Vibrio parahaemolyticus]
MSWPLVKLGEVAPSKALKNPVVLSDDNVWQLNLDMVESNSGRIINKLKAPLSEAGSSTHWFDERHVLYSKLRPYLNKVVLPDEQGLATTELVPMLPDPEKLDRRYLVHYLRSKQFVRWISDQVAGAKMPRVSMKIFWDHEIPLPPLAEQKRIAAILDKADAIRQKRKQAIELADEFLRSVFLDMFGDPVTNPKGWEVKKLSNIAHIQIGPFGTQLHKEDYIENGIPLINPTHIVQGSIVPNSNLTISSKKHRELSEYHLKAGDIVMGRRGEMGRCAIVHEQEAGWLCGTGSVFIRPQNIGVFSEYLNKLLSSQAIKKHLESES